MDAVADLGDDRRMPQQFIRAAIVPQNIDLRGPSGEVINAGRTPGVPLYHWMDGELAHAWFAEARRLAGVARGTLAPFTTAEWSLLLQGRPTGRPDGRQAMQAGFQALMYGFNALNIPWYMYAPARALWRQYVAGPPQVIGANADYAEYAATANYNDNWFVPTSDWPGWSQGSATQNTARLAAATPELGGPAGIAYTPSVFPWLQVPAQFAGDGGDVSGDPSYAPVSENSPAIGGGFPDLRQGNPWTHFRSVPQGQYRFYDNPQHDTGARSTLNWQVYSFDSPTFGYKRIGAPEVYFLPWLEAWSAMMADADPAAVVTAARAYTVYRNSKSATLNGGPLAFLQTVSSLPGEVLRSEVTGSTQTALQGAAAATAALGAALAPVTFGISGVIGGGIALALSVGSTLVRNSPRIARDEFGRFKPVLERGWLAGDPSDASSTGVPPLEIPDPPGFSRSGSPLTASSLANLGSMVDVTAYRSGGSAPQRSTPSTDVTTPLVVLAVGGALVYAGYQLLGPPARRRAGRSRTR